MQSKRTIKLPIYRKFQNLTSESLNSIVNSYKKYIGSKYIDYSDGIIEGLFIKVIDNNLFEISEGIFKLNSNVYLLDDKIYIKRPELEGRYALILNVEKLANKEYDEFEISVFFKETTLVSDDDFVLFNIILRDGANIYSNSTEFVEYEKEFNVIDLTNQKYSIKDELYTVNPYILTKFCEEMEKFNLNDFDFSMCMLFKNASVKKEVLISYINRKLNMKEKILSNKQIRNYLFKILKDIESNRIVKENINKDLEPFSII
ncbi:hypothetical protein [Oceanivirga miroungae]|uniref:Uncharacterized protein n=1 Tax=Oceanivirga miroungae TaxID=1130046 RepID=A0A6I8M9D0_9FUSO|nr:hypothetical protein [Oceanivirga miroungae]VWL84903.1 hypothetical protein OMES3154_00160 [Oceanivirga miroungae]